jgi:hypothetical protein
VQDYGPIDWSTNVGTVSRCEARCRSHPWVSQLNPLDRTTDNLFPPLVPQPVPDQTPSPATKMPKLGPVSNHVDQRRPRAVALAGTRTNPAPTIMNSLHPKTLLAPQKTRHNSPLLVQPVVTEDRPGDTGTVDRGVGVHWPDDDLDLRVDARTFFGRGADERECSHAFAVETHVLKGQVRFGMAGARGAYLGKGLGKGNLVALFNKVTDSVGVLGGVARGEALVGHIEKGEQLAVLLSR